MLLVCARWSIGCEQAQLENQIGVRRVAYKLVPGRRLERGIKLVVGTIGIAAEGLREQPAV
jgi:hypothetical protein